MKHTIAPIVTMSILVSLVSGCSSDPTSTEDYPPITQAIVPTSHGTPHFCYKNEPQGIDKYLAPAATIAAAAYAFTRSNDVGRTQRPFHYSATNYAGNHNTNTGTTSDTMSDIQQNSCS